MVWWDAMPRSGPGTTCRISSRRSRPATGRTGASGRTAWTRWPATDPFIMEADGKCQLFVPSGLKDGPLPTHYEPVESPVRESAVRPAGQSSRQAVDPAGQRAASDRGCRVPLCLHHVSADRAALRRDFVSRVTPHTAELQPEAFVEVSPELAGNWASQPGLGGARQPLRG